MALADLAPSPGRGVRREIALEGGTALIIDESYNASPVSMEAALAVLGQAPRFDRGLVLAPLLGLDVGELDELEASGLGPVFARGMEGHSADGPINEPEYLSGGSPC